MLMLIMYHVHDFCTEMEGEKPMKVLKIMPKNTDKASPII